MINITILKVIKVFLSPLNSIILIIKAINQHINNYKQTKIHNNFSPNSTQ